MSRTKGAQHENTSGRGCAWSAGPSPYYTRYHGGLHTGRPPDRNISADYLLADKGYDSDAIIKQAKDRGMDPVIPPKKNRIEQRPYDKELYKLAIWSKTLSCT